MIVDYQDVCYLAPQSGDRRALDYLIIYLGVTAGRMTQRQLRRGVNKNPDIILDRIYRGELLRRESLEFDSKEAEDIYQQLDIECTRCDAKASRDVVAKGLARCLELNLPITGLAWTCPDCYMRMACWG